MKSKINLMQNFCRNIFTSLILALAFSFFCNGQNKNSSALEIVKSVADRVIQDCQFEFETAKQGQVLGVQIIDFNKDFGNEIKGSAYTLSFIQSDSNVSVNLGISASKNISIWINDKEINFKKSENPEIKEIAYGMINFYDTVSIKINKGDNKILIKAGKNIKPSKIFLRQITDDPETEGWLTFSISPFLKDSIQTAWMIAGPFGNQADETPETLIKNYYKNYGKFINWTLPKENVLVELKIEKDNVFKKDSYADWNYANGETMLSILNLAEASRDEKYKNFVKSWCDFVIQNFPYFKYQYDSLYALRGSYHRIFRKSMLDDAGAPVFPFVQLYLQEKTKKYYDLINEMSEYVLSNQPRLTDGTLCRPEPKKWTVWADDLFMSVPLFLRMGKIIISVLGLVATVGG
ncbi:MAG: glycoside hydrolase family 88 protein, partial [Ignavibacteriaceae bacterium]